MRIVYKDNKFYFYGDVQKVFSEETVRALLMSGLYKCYLTNREIGVGKVFKFPSELDEVISDLKTGKFTLFLKEDY